MIDRKVENRLKDAYLEEAQGRIKETRLEEARVEERLNTTPRPHSTIQMFSGMSSHLFTWKCVVSQTGHMCCPHPHSQTLAI